jgi:hypothetical protein
MAGITPLSPTVIDLTWLSRMYKKNVLNIKSWFNLIDEKEVDSTKFDDICIRFNLPKPWIKINVVVRYKTADFDYCGRLRRLWWSYGKRTILAGKPFEAWIALDSEG